MRNAIFDPAHGCPLQQTSSGWRSQSKGTFLISSRGDIIIKFQQIMPVE